MAQVESTTNAAKAGARDPTFRNYQVDAAKQYAQYRSPYPNQMIEMIIERHVSTGGHKGTVLDVGCGPGLATRQVAPFFQHAIGADPGESMIEVARSIPCTSASGEPARFEICSAEELHTIVPAESIDLITAATCAHWFEMPKFFTSAAKVLKPGGSIIMWASGGSTSDPATTPNAEEVHKLQQELEDEILAPYELPGNKLTRTLYSELEMPWTIETSDPDIQAALEIFDRSVSTRETFNEDGVRDNRFEGGYLFYRKAPLAYLKKVFGTVSPVVRWREAHKEQLERGEIEDCVDRMTRIMLEVMAKGPEGKSDIKEIAFSSAVVIIMVKKKAT